MSCETAADALDFVLKQRRRSVGKMRPFLVHFVAKDLRRELLHQDLDARLVLVVAASITVVDPQNRVEVSEQVSPWQELSDDDANHRRAAQAAANEHAEAHVPLGTAHSL